MTAAILLSMGVLGQLSPVVLADPVTSRNLAQVASRDSGSISTAQPWLSVSAPNVTLPIGTSYPIRALVQGLEDSKGAKGEGAITAMLSSTELGSYDPASGQFTAGVHAGTGSITFRASNLPNVAPFTVPIYVVPGPAATLIALVNAMSAKIGQPVRVSVMALDAGLNRVDAAQLSSLRWTADQGTISQDGTFIPTTEGTAHITGTLGTLTATASIDVVGPPARLVLQPTDTNVVMGKPTAVQMKVEDASGHVCTDFTGTIDIHVDNNSEYNYAYHFTASDYGVATIPITFLTAGHVLVTTAGPSVNGLPSFWGMTAIQVQPTPSRTLDAPVTVNQTSQGTAHEYTSDQIYVSAGWLMQFLSKIGFAASDTPKKAVNVTDPLWECPLVKQLDLPGLPTGLDGPVVGQWNLDNGDNTGWVQVSGQYSVPVVSLPETLSVARTGKSAVGAKTLSVDYVPVQQVIDLMTTHGMDVQVTGDNHPSVNITLPLSVEGVKAIAPDRKLPLQLFWSTAAQPIPAEQVTWRVEDAGATIDPAGNFSAIKPGIYTVDATFAGVTVSKKVTVESSVHALSLAIEGPTYSSVGTVTYPVLVTALDVDGNPMPNAAIDVALSQGGSSPLATASGTTNAGGVYTTTVTAPLSVTGIGTITATAASGVRTSASVTLGMAATGGSATSSVWAGPARVTVWPAGSSPVDLATGQAQSVTFTVCDANNNPLPGQSIRFGVTGGLQSSDLSASAATTDNHGQATVTLTASSARDGSVTATTPNNVVATSELFHVTAADNNTPPPVPTSITLSPANSTLTYIPGHAAQTVTAAVYDASGQAMSGVQVGFTLADGGGEGQLSTPSAITNSQGLASVTYTPGVHDNYATVAASVYGYDSVTATSGQMEQLTLDYNDSTPVPNGSGDIVVNAGDSVQFTFTVGDLQENNLSGIPIDFSLPSTLHGQLSATSAVSDGSGNVDVTYTTNPADSTGTIIATVAGTSITATSTPPVQVNAGP